MKVLFVKTDEKIFILEAGYKDSDKFNSERFNENVKYMTTSSDMKKYIESLKQQGFKTEDEIVQYCDYFIGYWLNRDFKNLQEHILYLVKRPVMFQNVEKINKLLVDKEIPQTLIEIISVFTPDSIDENLDLKDYIEDSEDGQSILVQSFKALNFLLYYCSDDKVENNTEIANLLIDFNFIENACTNIKMDYSELTRIAAIYLLSDLIQYERALFRFTRFHDFFKFLFNDFLNTEHSPSSTHSDFLEKFRSVIFLTSRTAQQSYIDYVDIFKEDMVTIIFFAFDNVPECDALAVRSMFYLMLNDPKFIFSQTTENLIQYAINKEDQDVIFFLLQILKLCNIDLPDPRLLTIYSNINFQCFNFFLSINQTLCLLTSNFFRTLFNRGSQFIQLAFDNFNDLFKAYEDASFEIKFSILSAFDLAFINASSEQMAFFLENNYDQIIFESITSHEKIGMCLDAMIAINNFDKDRIKSHEEIIYDLELIQSANIKKKNKEEEDMEDEDEVNKQKALFILSIFTKNENAES